MTFRAFIAVDIGPLPKLIELADRLKSTKADLKLVEPKNIHITLKFLGDTDETLVDEIEDHMKKCSAGIAPFNLSLESIGAFPSRNYMKVIWVGISGADPLVQMARDIDFALRPMGFKSDRKGFKPHLTVARVRSPKNKSELQRTIEAQKDDVLGTVFVDRIILKQSDLSLAGPTYTDVKEVKLQA